MTERPRYRAHLLHALTLAADDHPKVSADLEAHLRQSLARLIGGAVAPESLSELLQAHLEQLVNIAVELAGRLELTAARQLTTALALTYMTGEDAINEAAFRAAFKVPFPDAALDGLGVALGARAVDHARKADDLVGLASAHMNLGNRLRCLDDATGALSNMREGVKYFERMVASGQRGKLNSLASALHDLSVTLTAVGEFDEALSAAERAVGYFTELATEGRLVNLHFLALSRAQYSGELSRAGRPGEALSEARWAFENYEEMARESHAAYEAYLPYLEQGAGRLAAALGAAGEPHDALVMDQYSTYLCEELTGKDRGAYLCELANATEQLAARLYILGRPADAIAASSRPVEIYEELVANGEERYIPHLLRAYNTVVRYRCKAGYDLEAALRDCRRGFTLAQDLEATRPEAAGDLGSRLRVTDTDLCLRYTHAMDLTVRVLSDGARGHLHACHAWTSPPPVVLDGTDAVPPSLDQLADLMKGMGHGSQVGVAVNNGLLSSRLEELLSFIHSEPAVLSADRSDESLQECLRALPSVAAALRLATAALSPGQGQLRGFLADHGGISRLDPEEPAHSGAYATAAGALRMLDGPAVTLGASDKTFRAIVPKILRYLYVSGQHQAGIALGWFIRNEWTTCLDADDLDFISLNDRWAALVFTTGGLDRALTLWENVVDRRRRLLGTDHPQTFTASSNLAMCLSHLGLDERAQELYESLLQQGTQAFGPDNPDVLRLHGNFASHLFGRGQYEDALEIYRDLSRRYRSVNRPDHLKSLSAANGLALSLLALRRFAEAQVLAEDTLARSKRQLGPDHTDTRRYQATLESINKAIEEDMPP